MTITCSDRGHYSNKEKLGLLTSLQNLKTTSGEVVILVKLQVNVEVWKTLLKITTLYRTKSNFNKSNTPP